MSKARRDTRTPPRTLSECEVGDIIQTSAGYLSVTGVEGDRRLVRVYCPDTRRERSKPFALPGNVPVIRLLAPARDQPSSEPLVANTYMQVVKDRFSGVNGYAAVCAYDLRTLRYRDRYLVGRLSYAGDTFEQVTPFERPDWAKHGIASAAHRENDA